MARLALICGLALILSSGAAHAHAVLIESQPADGAVLREAPREVVLRFNEPVAPVMLRVLDIEAKAIADGSQARIENETLRLALPPDLPNATYVVTYRVISLDSHPVSGTIMFSLGEAPAPGQAAHLPAQDRMTVATVAASRTLFLGALLIAAGGILALWRVAEFDAHAVRRARRTLVMSEISALVFGAVSLGIAGCSLTGLSLAGLADPAAWRIALAAPLAKSLAVAATGLVLILAAVPRLEHGGNRLVAVAGSLIAVGSFALTGHAATAAPQWLMRWAVPLHALCAAFWLGSLPLLRAAVRTETPERAHRLVVRFSAHAIAAVVLILALGVAIAVVQVEHVAMLWQTAYGIVLMGKLAAVVLLLAVAAHNRWHATPLLAGARPGALIRAIYAEYLLFAAILALTATLGQLEPPRAAVERDTRALMSRPDFTASIVEAGTTVTLSVAPARAGHNALVVAVSDANGTLVTPQEIALEMSLPSAGIEPLRRKAVREASGSFIYHSNDLALPGRWRIDVHVLIDDFTKKVVSFAVEIR